MAAFPPSIVKRHDDLAAASAGAADLEGRTTLHAEKPLSANPYANG